MKNLLTIVTVLVSINCFALDLSSMGGAKLGAGITKEQLPKIVSSPDVYCLRVEGKNYLASAGAMKIFNKTATSRTKSVACSGKVKRQALIDGVEVIQLTKSKLTNDAYTILASALGKQFGN